MKRSDIALDMKLAEMLGERRFAPQDHLQKALKSSKITGRPLPETLNDDYGYDLLAIYEFLAQLTGIPYQDIRDIQITPEVIKAVPVKIAWHYGFMPLRISAPKKLLIAVDYPLSVKTQDEIRLHVGYELNQILARTEDITECVKKYYGFAANTVDKIVSNAGFQKPSPEQEISAIDPTGQLAGDATVIDLVNQIIHEAMRKRATDIHFEPYRGEFRVRYRIDGVLQDVNLPPAVRSIIALILSRIKIMANLDIIEKRIPQDGRAIVKIKDEPLDLRVSCVPTLNGESIVIRILPTQMIFDLRKLGLTDSNIHIFENLIQKPNGIILLTGPTGSGKTTTLYACLQRLNSKETKIITIEDPVEYEISGITQVPVNPKAGLDFAKGLRSMLRHDPDVMMVGEIRDFETAEIAIRAALTGHLVLSTLHTNDAASGVTRLLDIGLEPFLIASSLEAIIAQRLVRRICYKCKIQDTSVPEALVQRITKDLNLASASELILCKGKGCEDCGFTGFYGRTAIHEVLIISENIKRLITKKASSYEIRAQAIAEGMVTLLEDGWLKVAGGQTTPAEVINVVAIDTLAGPGPESLRDDSEKNRFLVAAAGGRDQRLYPRIFLQSAVKFVRIFYKIIEKKGEVPILDEKAEHVGTSENISASGLLMRTDQLLKLGEVLDLRLEITGEHQRLIHCMARVARTEESDVTGQYKAGLIFLDLASVDKSFLENFITLKKGAA